MPNLNKIKIPTTNNNKVLTTDENGIVKDTSIDISSIENAVSVKNYYLNLLKIPANTQITNEAYPDLYVIVSDIVSDILNKVQIAVYAISNKWSSDLEAPVYDKCQITYETGSQMIEIIFGSHMSDEHGYDDGISQFVERGNRITINLTQDNNINSVSYEVDSNISFSRYLSTNNTATGEQVTYLPEYDSQPANKKYVDQQIANIQSQINSIELTVDDILGQPESTETQN